MIGNCPNSTKIYFFLILFIETVSPISFIFSADIPAFTNNSSYSVQKDTLVKKIVDELTGDSISIESLGKLRIIEKDGTIKKNITLKEIHAYWIIYEKDNSLHDFLISSIERIEIGDNKYKAIYFNKNGKALIRPVP